MWRINADYAIKARYRGRGVGHRGGWDKGVPRGHPAVEFVSPEQSALDKAVKGRILLAPQNAVTTGSFGFIGIDGKYYPVTPLLLTHTRAAELMGFLNQDDMTLRGVSRAWGSSGEYGAEVNIYDGAALERLLNALPGGGRKYRIDFVTGEDGNARIVGSASGSSVQNTRDSAYNFADSYLLNKARYRGKGVGKRGGWDKGVPRGKKKTKQTDVGKAPELPVGSVARPVDKLSELYGGWWISPDGYLYILDSPEWHSRSAAALARAYKIKPEDGLYYVSALEKNGWTRIYAGGSGSIAIDIGSGNDALFYATEQVKRGRDYYGYTFSYYDSDYTSGVYYNKNDALAYLERLQLQKAVTPREIKALWATNFATLLKARYRGKGVGKRGGWDKGVPRGKRKGKGASDKKKDNKKKDNKTESPKAPLLPVGSGAYPDDKIDVQHGGWWISPDGYLYKLLSPEGHYASAESIVIDGGFGYNEDKDAIDELLKNGWTRVYAGGGGTISFDIGNGNDAVVYAIEHIRKGISYRGYMFDNYMTGNRVSPDFNDKENAISWLEREMMNKNVAR